MTEHQIQNAIWYDLVRKGHESVCPNYTPLNWWECDIFSVTKAGRFVEHEIKLSVQDFNADTKKTANRVLRDAEGKAVLDERRWFKTEHVSKHSMLSESYHRGPSRFFFVVPENLIHPDAAPPWAGLIYARHPLKGGWDDDNSDLDLTRVCLSVAKRAPKLHNQPADPMVLTHLRKSLCYRYWHIRTRSREPIVDPVA